MEEILELLPFNDGIKLIVGVVLLFLIFIIMVFKEDIVKFLKKR
jgi:hypothetical protein